jgi:hypothetical protein
MYLKDFINYRPICLVCGDSTVLNMSGTLEETIGEDFICSLFSYESPVFRKNFITFAESHFAMFMPGENFSKEIYRTKYNSFILDNNIVSFDDVFPFKMKLTFNMTCQSRHYSYGSRDVRITNDSPDITRGYNVANEWAASKSYRVLSNFKKQKTYIYNLSKTRTPAVISFMDISIFPCNDEEKFEKKMENLLLLA